MEIRRQRRSKTMGCAIAKDDIENYGAQRFHLLHTQGDAMQERGTMFAQYSVLGKSRHQSPPKEAWYSHIVLVQRLPRLAESKILTCNSIPIW